MSKIGKSLCGVVQRQARKSLKRAKDTSQEILSAIFPKDCSEAHPLYDLFLRDLESHKDPQTKKKD
jgi:anaerobic ribonucleoside-triphosphate reductase